MKEDDDFRVITVDDRDGSTSARRALWNHQELLISILKESRKTNAILESISFWMKFACFFLIAFAIARWVES